MRLLRKSFGYHLDPSQTCLVVHCRQLKVSRTHFLDLVNNAGSEVDEVTVAFTEYLGLVRGLVEAPQGGESKLHTLTTFKWTNSLHGRTPRYCGIHYLVPS